MKKIKFMPVLTLVLCLFSGQVVLAEDVADTTEGVEAPVSAETADATEEINTAGVQSEGRYLELDSDSVQTSSKFVNEDVLFTLSFKFKDNSIVFNRECVILLKLDNGSYRVTKFDFPVHYNELTGKYTGTHYLYTGIHHNVTEDSDVSAISISFKHVNGDHYTIVNGEPSYNDDYNSSQDLSGFNFHYITDNYPFRDVPHDAWYKGAVDYVNYYGIMTGMNDTTFAPASTLSRAQFATIIHRMVGSPDIAYSSKFKDVSDGQFYTKPVLWANSVGIITGYENGKFGPADVITREQMATMMYRYAQYNGYDVSNQADISAFPDYQKVSGFAKTAISWTSAEGIITGDQGKINPQGNASRAVSATIVMRFLNAYQ
ncbi:MAG: S-layer homology domain-containing protein [Ruminococcus sp.]|nr:S-layer homology domain-containing protein [Ruminococcus sp.]